MRVFDVYDHRFGRIVATVHARDKAGACKQVSNWSGIGLEHLVATYPP